MSRCFEKTFSFKIDKSSHQIVEEMLEQKQKPDLILLDVSMPVLSGTETLRIIKERYPDLKVVAQSAHALIGDRDRFLKAGFDEYLPKPF